MKKPGVILISILFLGAIGTGFFLFQSGNLSMLRPLHFNPPEYKVLMSSIFNVTVAAWITPDWEELYRHAEETARVFDHRDKSGPLAALNDAGRITNAPLLTGIVKAAVNIAEKSSGAFDPTIMPIIELWDIEHGGRLPVNDEIAASLKHVGYRNINIAPDGTVSLTGGARIDLGGIGQGTVVDEVSSYLDKKGYDSYLVDASGDILVRGRKPDGSQWRIAIRNPRLPGVDVTSPSFSSGELPILGLVQVGEPGKKTAVVTSGDYERFFVKDGIAYHHLLDPVTGYPARGTASVTVIASNCQSADALATAAFVLGFEKGLALLESLPDVEGLVVRDLGSGATEMRATSGFPAIIKTAR